MFRNLIFNETFIGPSLVVSPCRRANKIFFLAGSLQPIIRPPSPESAPPARLHLAKVFSRAPRARVFSKMPSELLILPLTVFKDFPRFFQIVSRVFKKIKIFQYFPRFSNLNLRVVRARRQLRALPSHDLRAGGRQGLGRLRGVPGGQGKPRRVGLVHSSENRRDECRKLFLIFS